MSAYRWRVERHGPEIKMWLQVGDGGLWLPAVLDRPGRGEALAALARREAEHFDSATPTADEIEEAIETC